MIINNNNNKEINSSVQKIAADGGMNWLRSVFIRRWLQQQRDANATDVSRSDTLV